MLQSSALNSLFFDPFPFPKYRLPSSKVHIGLSYDSFVRLIIQSALSRLSIWTQADLDRLLLLAERLGLDPLNKQWQKETSQDSTKALDSLIQSMLKQRNDARASKNFEVADSVRDALNSAGILIEDTPQGSRWSINKETK